MKKLPDTSLDERLRKADPAAGAKPGTTTPSTAPAGAIGSLRSWWLTTSNRVRRSLAGGAAVAASATAVASLTLNPVGGGPLIYLAESSNQAARSSAAIGYGDMDSKMMMPYVEYEYLAGPNLSAATGRGHVYRLELAGTAESVARRAADFFGVEGEFGKSMYFDAQWPTYVIGSEDGTAPAVSVGWSGTGSWWYNNPAAYPEQKCLSEKRVGKGANAYVECLEYEPAVSGKNPDESETLTLASQFFTAMGVPFEQSDITVSVDDWASYASVALSVDGQKTALEWSISWSGNGEIAWAQGNSISVVDVGEFDTVSDAAAVERLADWRWYGAGPTDLIAGGPAAMLRSATYDGVAAATDETGTETTTEPSEPAPGETPVEPAPVETDVPVEPVPTEEPAVEPTEEPLPLPTEPQMEKVTITIDEAKPALLLIWDQSGNAWLVPGVALTGAESWWQTVITLVEGVIELPEPVGVLPID